MELFGDDSNDFTSYLCNAILNSLRSMQVWSQRNAGLN